MVLKDSPGGMVQEKYRRKIETKEDFSQPSDPSAHIQEEVRLAPRSVKGVMDTGVGAMDPKGLSAGMRATEYVSMII